METFTLLISLILLVLMVINVGVTAFLFKVAHRAQWGLPALNERAISAGLKAVGSFLIAILGANRIFNLNMDETSVLLILSVAIIMHSLPPVVWVFFYRTGRFLGGSHHIDQVEVPNGRDD